MEDILLMQFLRKKGIISDKDMHEFHELTTANLDHQSINNTDYFTQHLQKTNEEQALNIVSEMYHIENGKKYIGEKYDMYKAKEICNKYKGLLSPLISVCDIYIAINAQYHDYINLYKTWFSDNVDNKIIESAIVFWFMDDDYKEENKVHNYFKKH